MHPYPTSEECKCFISYSQHYATRNIKYGVFACFSQFYYFEKSLLVEQLRFALVALPNKYRPMSFCRAYAILFVCKIRILFALKGWPFYHGLKNSGHKTISFWRFPTEIIQICLKIFFLLQPDYSINKSKEIFKSQNHH